MKKLFFIFLFFVFFSGLIAEAREVKFAVISDTHISLSKTDVKGQTSGMTQSIHNLLEAVKQINDSDAEFVIFSGDAVKKADKLEIVMFAKIIKGLKKPYYVGLGDHDVAQVIGIDKKEFYHLVNMFSRNKIRKLPYVKKAGNNLVFLFMDGVNEFIPGTKGYFKEHELMWLDSKLKKYKDKKVVIIQHYPIVPPSDKPQSETYNKDEYLKLLSEHDNVISIISGHYHEDFEVSEQGIRHISVPSLSEDKEYYMVEIGKNKTGKYIIKTKIFDVK